MGFIVWSSLFKHSVIVVLFLLTIAIILLLLSGTGDIISIMKAKLG